MIRIYQEAPPDFLTDEKAQQLTQDFITENKNVWNKCQIKEVLLRSSYGKCCYCECKIDNRAIYMEVEHFKCKSKYPDEVVSWSNLLAACKRCNMVKKNHDVIASPIINPYDNIPSKHLALKSRRLTGIDDLGKNTIAILDLNDFERLGKERSILIDKMEEKIAELIDFETELNDKNLTKIKNGVRGLLSESQPKCEFSAIKSTFLINSIDFLKLIELLKEKALWDQDHAELLATCNSLSLSTICHQTFQLK